MNREQIAERLKAIREGLGFSQPELAAKLDIPLGTIKKIETGQNTPGGETLMKYAAAGFSPSWILADEGPMRLDQRQAQGTIRQAQSRSASGPTSSIPAAEPELLALLIDAIQRTYKEAGARLSPLDLGRLSGDMHNEILAEGIVAQDWRGAVQMAAGKLRREIAATAADASSRKREAS